MRWISVLVAAAAMSLAGLGAASGAAQAAGNGGSFVLSASDFKAKSYAPTFTGNGYLGVRVPPAGQGYAGGKVPAQSELAGFYAKPDHPKTEAEGVQQRANIPTWSTLFFGEGDAQFSLGTGSITGWKQAIDLRTGVISTSGTWKQANGHSTGFAYQVLTDRANEHVAAVQLTLKPQWSGIANVSDVIDGSPATLTTQVGKSLDAAGARQYMEVMTQGTSIHAAIATQLATSANITATPTELDANTDQSIGQQISFPVVSGRTYAITKFVGVADSQDSPRPVAVAQAEATTAATSGMTALLAENNAAWAALWNGRVEVRGDAQLATDVNASQFYLWASTRAGLNWSISPAGLSSNGYDGHIFWDAETWMFPSLLAQHPDLAAAMNAYRHDRLNAAAAHATATGYAGDRFPWESALDGTEQIPPPVSINSEGLYEMHITADVALAQWQYYVATGDRTWLVNQGWPVISGAAAFWASKATRSADGSYHITHVTGPDEENPNVSDEAYTRVAARTTLNDALQAAAVVGATVPADWSAIAKGLNAPVRKVAGKPIHPEFSGYRNQQVKQADVTLMQYPWLDPMSKSIATNDINFYVPRTDPGGPSMSDAVNSIDTSALGTPGCASFVFTERSYEPFIRDRFDQFSETKYGGAFTFMTGIGGFLQEFLYGYSGMRFANASVRLAPSLSGALTGVVLHDVQWQGRTFTVSISRTGTSVTLASGSPLPVVTPAGPKTVAAGQTLRIATARPDIGTSDDLVRCQAARASSAQPGAPALAGVDGSPADNWQPTRLPASFTVPVRGGPESVSHATVVWGQLWPGVTKPNVHPAPSPVKPLRATAYALQVSGDGRSWTTVASVSGRKTGTTDSLRFPVVRAKFARLRITAGGLPAIKPTKNLMNPPPTQPMLMELSVSG